MQKKETSKSLLLDTHVWLWLASADSSLTRSAHLHIKKAAALNRLFVSAISVWEVAMLEAKGRIKLTQPTVHWVNQALSRPEINLIPLSPEIAIESCHLPGNFHGDPADRILIASSRLENLPLMTKDRKIIAYSEDKFLDVLPL